MDVAPLKAFKLENVARPAVVLHKCLSFSLLPVGFWFPLKLKCKFASRNLFLKLSLKLTELSKLRAVYYIKRLENDSSSISRDFTRRYG